MSLLPQEAPKSKYSHSKQILTANGYDFYECVSAMQKEIRRCKEEEALFWALECGSTTVESSKGEMKNGEAWDYVWHRLSVTAAEEIGLVDIQAVMLVQSLRSAHAYRRDPQILSMAVLYLARSPKNREVNDYLAYVGNKRNKENWRIQVPDYAVDGHTYRGKMMGKNKLQEWWLSGRVIKNQKGVNRYFRAVFRYEGKRWGAEWVKAELDMIDMANKMEGIEHANDMV